MSDDQYPRDPTLGVWTDMENPTVDYEANRWARPKEASLPAPGLAELVATYTEPAPSRSAGPAELSKKSSVDHPTHYQDRVYHSTCNEPIECIDIVEGFSFNAGSAIKYIWRAGAKGDAIEDLEKAKWYLERMIDNLKNERRVNDLR